MQYGATAWGMDNIYEGASKRKRPIRSKIEPEA